MGAHGQRLALIGMGAIGRTVLQALRQELPEAEWAVLERPHRTEQLSRELGVAAFGAPAELLAWSPDAVVECAGHSALAELVPEILEAGVDVITVSLGALADERTLTRLQKAAEDGRAALQLAAGSVGGLDALRAGQMSGLEEVTYEGRKPPAAWKGTPAEEVCDLEGLIGPYAFFEGTARQAAAAYPKNANVTAAAALAGLGFDHTRVRLIADPGAAENTHRIRARGGFGTFTIELANAAMPENPKSSWLVALSVQDILRQRVLPIRF